MHKLLLAIVAAVSLATPAAAQSRLVPADSAEVANHQVSEAEYARFAAIVRRMESVFATDRDAFRGIEQHSDVPISVADVAARYEANPAMHAELARGGMTAREFLIVGVALVRAVRAPQADDGSVRLNESQAANARLAQSRRDELRGLFGIIGTVTREH
ncbi:MAG TPA: hypothetical protein VGX50_12415 [Longimicrobium sp.]|jgi:hypothetical protein|nr:hypothetical protein [Longimicrobium sp.]